MRRLSLFLALSISGSLATSCGGATPRVETIPELGVTIDLDRLRFNQLALRLDLPLYWASDADADGRIDPDEVRALAFYPSEGSWVDARGHFTPGFHDALRRIGEEGAAPAPTDARLLALHQELDTTAPTLIENDLSEMPATHRAFAQRMATVAGMIDRLYARQVGAERLASQVPDEPTSRSIFRRNWGPRCRSAAAESNPACSAIEGAPAQPVDVYPEALQSAADFCQRLEAESGEVLSPFTVVRTAEGSATLAAIPYTVAYRELMGPIATELRAAADALSDGDEPALQRYLRAAATAFEDNDWAPADEAWAAMNARNSRWYVRVGPDEVYWDPCSQHAGFHLTFARINQGSLAWQDRLTPLLGPMEESLASLVPGEYTARQVAFHLPDFIDIVINAGDDRDAYGGTIGQSLPNWGPVSNEGRGRTVAMTNLYQDPDSRSRGREIAESLLVAEAMPLYTDDEQAGLMSTILHEATHNLGPSHEYRSNGLTDEEAFGGGLASMLEELKAQSGALFFIRMLRERGILTPRQAEETYVSSFVWGLGHISRGMYTPTGQRKPYSQLSAVQIGFLIDRGAVTWDAEALAANGTDRGAFRLDLARFDAAVVELMTQVMHIKATGDRPAAEALAARYVDGALIPMALITERYARFPRVSFVYSFRM